jgi:hypothetical protein
MARPKSKYNPELFPDIIQAGMEGKTWNIICSEILGVSVNAANEWVKKYPDFAVVKETARTNARAYWEALVLENVNSRTFNSRLAEMMLKALDPDNYREPKHQIDANIKADVKIDLKAETDKLIAELEEAGKKKAKKEEK